MSSNRQRFTGRIVRLLRRHRRRQHSLPSSSSVETSSLHSSHLSYKDVVLPFLCLLVFCVCKVLWIPLIEFHSIIKLHHKATVLTTVHVDSTNTKGTFRSEMSNDSHRTTTTTTTTAATNSDYYVTYRKWNDHRYPSNDTHNTIDNNNNNSTNASSLLLHPSWCQILNHSNDGNYKDDSSGGFIFHKMFKTASSTGVSVHLRIARQVAKRIIMKQRQQQPRQEYQCQSHYHHSYLLQNRRRQFVEFNNEDGPPSSFFWTSLRHPTSRSISSYLYYHVSTEEKDRKEPQRQKQPRRHEPNSNGDGSSIINARNDIHRFLDYMHHTKNHQFLLSRYDDDSSSSPTPPPQQQLQLDQQRWFYYPPKRQTMIEHHGLLYYVQGQDQDQQQQQKPQQRQNRNKLVHVADDMLLQLQHQQRQYHSNHPRRHRRRLRRLFRPHDNQTLKYFDVWDYLLHESSSASVPSSKSSLMDSKIGSTEETTMMNNDDSDYVNNHPDSWWDDDNQPYIQQLVIQDVLTKYNFIALAERWEESMVVLQLLLGLEETDVLAIPSKSGGSWSWDYRIPPKTITMSKSSSSSSTSKSTQTSHNLYSCFQIVPKEFIEDELLSVPYVQDYLTKDFVRGNVDFVLYDLANKSLDATIDSLGRSTVERAVQKYRWWQHKIQEECIATQNTVVHFPCSSNGQWQIESEHDCYERDFGCGYQCIDDVIQRHQLQHQHQQQRSTKTH